MDVQLLLHVGRLAVYRSMWAVLREFYYPTKRKTYTPGSKPDPSDISESIDVVSNTDIESTLKDQLLPNLGVGYYIVTEEVGCNRQSLPGKTPDAEDEKLIIFVDPVDFTAAAARGLDGSILVSFYHRDDGMLACIVGDIFRQRLYCAAADSFAYYQEVVFDEDPRSPVQLLRRHLDIKDIHLAADVIPLSTSRKQEMEDIALNVFCSKVDRLIDTVKIGRKLWEAKTQRIMANGKKKEEHIVKEIYTVGGSLGPTRVADGTWDVSLEFVKGFRFWDFAPGAFIAKRAGAAVIDLETGMDIDFSVPGISDEGLRRDSVNLIVRLTDKTWLDQDRQRFIAAATRPLANKIMEILM